MKVGVAGLGLLGSAMAARLADTGYLTSVYNRDRSKAARFKVDIAASPKELAERCELVLTVVTDFDAVREVLLGNNGIAKSANRRLIVVDVSTISPMQSEQSAKELREMGIEMLGMPVMGGPAAAEAGELVPIVAGSSRAYERARPVIEKLGKQVFYVGEQDGSANAIKLACNLNIALIASALSEGIALVKAVGIDPSIFVKVLNSTYFKTGLSEKKGPKMVRNEFDPSFYLKNMLKDLELAASIAQANKITLPQTSLAQKIFRAASNSGYSESDYTAICAFLAKINGMDGK